MRSKLQNAHLYKTALSPRLLRFQTCSEAVVNCWQRCRMEFFYEGSRLNLKTTEFYRVTHGLVDIPLPKDLLPMPYKNTRNFHPKKYRPLACNTNYYMGTFFPSTVNIWNTLPAATLDQPNIAKFKDELDRFYWLYSKMSLTVFIEQSGFKQEKGTFQRFEIYKHDSARQWLKREQQNLPPAPGPAPRLNSKEVVTGPRALKTAPRALLYPWTLGLSCHQKSYFKQAKYRQSDKPK